MKKFIKTIFIVGPTASGKSELALAVASKYNGEIICADSRTIYKDLDIGTAKPNKQEQKLIKHFGLDLISPDVKFSAADFQKLARHWEEDILNRGKLPIIVGGTGLYVDGLFYDYKFGDKADEELRNILNQRSITELQDIILKNGYIMPENKNNKRYLIRAIEQKGVNKRRGLLSADNLIIGLNPGKDVLNQRIHVRGQNMIQAGLIKEIENLANNYGFEVPGASGNIYQAFKPYFEKSKNIEDCLLVFESLDRRLAKRQLTWFKRNKNIQWFPSVDIALRYISSIM